MKHYALLFFIFAPFAAPVPAETTVSAAAAPCDLPIAAHAPALQTDADSLDRLAALRQRLERLHRRLDTVTVRLEDLRKRLEQCTGRERDSIETQIAREEAAADRLERSIAALEERLSKPGAPPGEDEGTIGEQSGRDLSWEDSTDTWEWDEEGEEGEEEPYSWKPKPYKKYPGGFTFVFPIESRLAETFFRYNRVEGVFIGFAKAKRLYWHSRPPLVGTGSIGYGFANHRWRYGLGLFAPLYLENMIVEFGVEGHSYTDSKDQWIVDRDENTATAFFAREDFMDYFGREGFSTGLSWYWRGPGSLFVRVSASYVHDTYENLGRRTNWSLFGGGKSFRPQPLINPGNLNSFVFTAAVNTSGGIASYAHGWNAVAVVERAGGFVKGDYAFTQATVDIRRYQPLCRWVNLNGRVRVGLSDGTIPLQRLIELGGIGTLPGFRFKEFSGAGAALVNAEILLRNPIFKESKGWVSSSFFGMNLILFADWGVTDEVEPSRIVSTRDFRNGAVESTAGFGFFDNRWYSDIGFAIGNTDGTVRIGVAWPLSRTEHSRSARFVLRLARPF
ncbi:MAG: BamA/TamA family outer membrane protein [Bacteroidota bacterium]|nr:BamA/TamA family outer membrane protein [Bacteroidota bacterium]